MSEECNHHCEGCSQNCDHRIEKVKPNEYSSIKKVIGVISGKGGVGKSLVSSLIASELAKKGHRVALLDADITGPSIPKSFGIKEKAFGDNNLIYPAISELGIQIMSSNLLLENEEDPILWRGPLIGDLVKQFYTDVFWKDVDYMVVDMPPGTGDVALTTFQYIPVDGIVIVTTPQDLVGTIVKKAIVMARQMDIKILGLVENMSYVECPKCQEKIYIYGESKIEELLKQYDVKLLARLPIRREISLAVDEGQVESISAEEELKEVIEAIKRV